MTYFVIEMQDMGDSGAAIPFAFTDKSDAEEKYHQLLAVAAKTTLSVHGVTLIRADGFVFKSEAYGTEVG